jgi:hypothetical protein
MPANDRRPPQRPTAHQRRQGRREAAARGARSQPTTATTPTRGLGSSTPSRARLEAISHPLLLRLHALPGWVVPVATLVLLLAGLFLDGVIGFVCLIALAVFLGWLLALSWSAVPARGRLLRTAAVAMVIAAAVFQLLR